jgi:hypothetical protein
LALWAAIFRSSLAAANGFARDDHVVEDDHIPALFAFFATSQETKGIKRRREVQ